MKSKPICNICGVSLNSENWFPVSQKLHRRICKRCHCKKARTWEKANPDKTKAIRERSRIKRGQPSMSENTSCSMYLGVHIAERVLHNAFKDVEVMPYGNPGYDFICNRGMKIDVKSACMEKNGRWLFHINHNTTANYFLCIAFDNRQDLNPLYVWILHGHNVNHLVTTSINKNTVYKWDEYKLDISKVVSCCNMIKGN